MISLKNGNKGEGGEKYQELFVSTRSTRTFPHSAAQKVARTDAKALAVAPVQLQKKMHECIAVLHFGALEC